MSTFINLDIEKAAESRFLWKHLLFLSIWLTVLCFVFLRLDFQLLGSVYSAYPWVANYLPLVLFLIIGMIVLRLKWYYTITLFLYPILLFVWFLPKTILMYGKFYILLDYLNFIVSLFYKPKKTFYHLLAIVIAVTITWFIDNPAFTLLAIGIAVYFYCLYLFRYFRKSLSSTKIFRFDVAKGLQEFIDDNKIDKKFLIDNIEKQKEAAGTTEEERSLKTIERLIMVNAVMEFFSLNFSASNNKRAFILFTVYQFLFCFFISFAFFVFLNYQIYQLVPASFTAGTYSLFDFIYYTFKSITAGGLDSMQPLSVWSKTIEIACYIVFCLFILVILLSFIITYRHDKLNHNISLAVSILKSQNELFECHIKEKYKKSIKEFLDETQSIKLSVGRIQNIIARLF